MSQDKSWQLCLPLYKCLLGLRAKLMLDPREKILPTPKAKQALHLSHRASIIKYAWKHPIICFVKRMYEKKKISRFQKKSQIKFTSLILHSVHFLNTHHQTVCGDILPLIGIVLQMFNRFFFCFFAFVVYCFLAYYDITLFWGPKGLFTSL